MPHKLLILFISTLFSFNFNNLHAQLGLKVGLTSSNLRVEPSPLQGNFFKNNLQYRAQGGIVYAIKVFDQLILEPGIILNAKGASISSARLNVFGNFERIETKFTLHFVDIPLTAKYLFHLGKAKFFIQAGASIGYSLDEDRMSVFPDSSCLSCGIGTLIELQKFDFSFFWGAGFIIKEKLHLGFTFNQSTTSIKYGIGQLFRNEKFLPSLQIGASYFLNTKSSAEGK